MASIAVTTAGKVHVVESLEQHTLRAGTAILAGDAVTIDATTGLFVKADADGAGTLGAVYGIATRSVAANEAVTAIRRGVMTGWTWGSTAYWLPVLAADTPGEITVTSGESNGASADVVIGRVISIDNALIGGSPEKALLLTL
jgi:hypothetical protein